ncbi:uncharacterized protein C8R40DRAFT_1236404 [Lentinula edodes]|uniref:uncharacterized protein n=1 Tax=Lentinula edodes TaxID=5353 RepID=UPI001E8E1228|nr:uncharacterized protein C8R40DRAFT_1236404 [Lentinula edodes]KAH7876772.1 hypothetical protein C8R40DRAFT_1236404 [Lentinula edodes]
MDNWNSPVIDLDESKFRPADWLNCGKKWPMTPPPSLVLARAELLVIPPDVFSPLFPISPAISAYHFANSSLPPRSSDIITGSVDFWFSREPPATEVQRLLTRSAPPKSLVNQMKAELGSYWLSGYQSITDPRNGATEQFPFYVLEFWTQVEETTKMQESWGKAIQYVERQKEKVSDTGPKAVLAKAWEMLHAIGWNECLPHYNMYTTALIGFLGSGWLSGDQIDLMVGHMSMRLEAQGSKSRRRVVIAPLAFANKIQNPFIQNSLRKVGEVQDTVLKHFETVIVEDRIEVLYAPVHVNGNHWIAVAVDFGRGEVYYGDSLSQMSPPRVFLQRLDLWLRKRFNRRLVDKGFRLECGVQRDTFNCGICVANAISHAVFGDPLWTSDLALSQRMQWFIDLSFDSPCPISDTTATECTEREPFPELDLAKPSRRLCLVDLLNPIASIPSNIGSTAELSGSSESDDDSESDNDCYPVTTIHTSPKSLTGPTTSLLKSFFGSKRSQSCSPEPTDSETETETEHQKGESRSAVHSMKIRQSQRDGTFVVTNARLASWKNGLQEMDSGVECRDNGIDFCHSKCRKWYKAKQAYDLTRARAHMKTCSLSSTKSKTTQAILSSHKITAFFQKSSAPLPSMKTSKPNLLPKMVACCGLTASYDPRIETYLSRTGYSGSGGTNVAEIAKTLFNMTFSTLDEEQRQKVITTQELSQTWENKHHLVPPAVYSRRCTKETLDLSPHLPLPCNECLTVYKSRAFKNAIRRQKPSAKNYIHTNHRFRPKVLGEIYALSVGTKELIEEQSKKSPFVRYALGVLQGKYDDKVFEGLTKAMLIRNEKEENGIGLQNFKYSPAYDEFTNIMRITSPSAFRVLREWFPARTSESFRQKESRKPRFPMEICDHTFEMAVAHLQSLGYKGPVGLCCDDAKLFASLRLYWDSGKKKHFLIGGSDGAVEVSDPDSVEQVIRDAKIQKATKIRIWCLMLQAPKSGPIVLYAMPLGTSLTAEKLEPYSQRLIRGLINSKIQVVSYACDGTEIERKIQALLVTNGDSRIEYAIAPPKSSGDVLKCVVPIFDSQPVAMIQDSKHALKTFRNNLYSGARLLVLGNHSLFYAQIHKLAHDPGVRPGTKGLLSSYLDWA